MPSEKFEMLSDGIKICTVMLCSGQSQPHLRGLSLKPKPIQSLFDLVTDPSKTVAYLIIYPASTIAHSMSYIIREIIATTYVFQFELIQFFHN
ncbi:hypothetical protein BG910_02625 [Neisseria chenwenguii]|uniref:Uncharacterized protein n=1 Tax=Neisseria chenwenguii TaxID=1853278 RepID=A0A220RZX1_9NEIS|nr:hypothetical protein BG910_02625 [Neisseria chenwenguii]